MHEPKRLTDNQKDLLLSIVGNQFVFIRNVSGEVLKSLSNGKSDKEIKEVTRFVFLLSDALHNIPSVVNSNNLNYAGADIKIFVDLIDEIEKLGPYFKMKQRSGIKKYEKDRTKVIELFSDILPDGY